MYILRNFNPIYIGDNFDLDFTPQFLLQRAIIGETNSFRLKDSSVTSKNITNSNIEISDYFSLNTTLSGEINEWDLLLKADLKTFNTDRFYIYNSLFFMSPFKTSSFKILLSCFL